VSWIVFLFTALYPSISGPPVFATNISATDFTFECKIQYKRVTADDGARFDVVLTFDGVVDETTLQKTTSLEKTVVFNSTHLKGHFGTDVSKIFYFKIDIVVDVIVVVCYHHLYYY